MDDDLAEFCRREHPRLASALVLVCGSVPVAEDLAQETLARVCKDWRRIRGMAAPGAYTHRIAMNLAASAFRRKAAERRANARHARETPTQWSDPDAASAVALRQALGRVRPEQRRVLVLRYFLDYSVSEVAQILEIPEGTVKTHAHRGVTVLRALLGTAIADDDLAASNG